jgi:2-polyprenyl-6-methoxyphenol hydroxylase-like FAD-dependent oxidoreductase
MDFAAEVAALRASGWIQPTPTGLPSLWPTRPLLETLLRRLLVRKNNVQVVPGVEAIGLEIDACSRICRGVRVTYGNGNDKYFASDLVVDAAGRGSKAPRWLERAGIRPPDELIIDPRGGYSARFFRPTRGWPSDWWWRGIVIECDPPETCIGGVLLPVEGGLWLATLMGFSGERLPATEDEFTEFARRLRSPVLATALEHLEPVSPIRRTRSFANRWRLYHLWATPLARFISVGDATCTLNPMYSQGMTVAAVSARLLSECCCECSPTSPALPSTFHRRQARFMSTPWQMAVAADSHYPGVTVPAAVHIARRFRFLEAALQCSWADPKLHSHLSRIIHLVSPPEVALQLWVIGRVLRRLAGRLFSQPRPIDLWPPRRQRRAGSDALRSDGELGSTGRGPLVTR